MPFTGNGNIANITASALCKLLASLCVLCAQLLSGIPWTIVLQAPLSMEFSRQEYWSGLKMRPDIYPPKERKSVLERYLHPHVHCGVIHCNGDLRNKVSVHQQMNG